MKAPLEILPVGSCLDCLVAHVGPWPVDARGRSLTLPAANCAVHEAV